MAMPATTNHAVLRLRRKEKQAAASLGKRQVVIGNDCALRPACADRRNLKRRTFKPCRWQSFGPGSTPRNVYGERLDGEQLQKRIKASL
jgi:hypothetical protein